MTAAAPTPDWPTCQRNRSCTGVQFGAGDICLAHLHSGERAEALAARTSTALDLRGTTIDPALLDLILGDRDVTGTATLGSLRCERARFTGAVVIDSVRFTDNVDFSGATFDEALSFGRTKFATDARFGGAVFSGEVAFGDVTFGGTARFDHASFGGEVRFYAYGEGGLVFNAATFAKRARLRVDAAAELSLVDARFDRWTEIGAVVPAVRCDGARFAAGVALRLAIAEVHAERTEFAGPSTITGTFEVSRLSTGPDSWIHRTYYERIESGQRAFHLPRMASLCDTDVSNLVLTDIYLGECQFDGTHRLDQIRIEGACEFGRPRGRWRTQRQTIANEYSFPRSTTGSRLLSAPPRPEQVAPMYRALRKSFEDSKNEAGAGDFYYGEMEMRRRAKSTRLAERVILWFYWLLSGYGQRAGRALLALLVLITTVAGLLALWGQPVEVAARIAVGAVVFRDDRTELTAAGEWTVLVARFLGPVLLALAVLAIRARVKR